MIKHFIPLGGPMTNSIISIENKKILTNLIIKVYDFVITFSFRRI
jgi:hypothetical protein